MWPTCLIVLWIIWANNTQAIENVWNVNKHQLLYTQKSLEAIKERNWNEANYYSRKIDDKEILEYLLWLQSNLSATKSFLAVNWPSLTSSEKLELANLLIPPTKHSFLSKFLKSLSNTKSLLPQKNPSSLLFSSSYYVKDNGRQFLLAWNKNKDLNTLYDYLLWAEKNNYLGTGLNILLKNLYLLPPSEKNSKWWQLKKLYIRDVILSKNPHFYRAIYRLASTHGFSSGKDFADGEWLAGWIALVFLKDSRQAYNHFYHLYNNVKKPISKSRAAYWLGRTLVDQPENAEKWYRIGAQYSYTFYGQLSLLKINPNAKLQKLVDSTIYSGNLLKQNQLNSKLLKAFYVVAFLQENKLAEFLMKKILEINNSPSIVSLINQVSLKSHNPYIILLSAQLTQVPEEEFLYLYPIYYLKQQAMVDNTTALVLALIRQESAFNVNAESSAGAQGLMQLLPKSAVSVCNLLNYHNCHSTSLFSPVHNVHLGTTYIKNDLNYYNGSLILAIAAYNAGTAAVDRWIDKIGDVRTYTRIEEIINWIESIPYAETRDYVMRVLSNMQVYKSLLKPEQYKVKELENDLKRV